MSMADKYPNYYDVCKCGKHKTLISKYCLECSANNKIQYHTISDVIHSSRHGQSAKFNIVRSRARVKYKHLKVCSNCGYDKHWKYVI